MILMVSSPVKNLLVSRSHLSHLIEFRSLRPEINYYIPVKQMQRPPSFYAKTTFILVVSKNF